MVLIRELPEDVPHLIRPNVPKSEFKEEFRHPAAARSLLEGRGRDSSKLDLTIQDPGIDGLQEGPGLFHPRVGKGEGPVILSALPFRGMIHRYGSYHPIKHNPEPLWDGRGP